LVAWQGWVVARRGDAWVMLVYPGLGERGHSRALVSRTFGVRVDLV